MLGFIDSWIIGWIAGGFAVILVVLLLLLATRLASHVAAKAEAILLALEDTRASTEGLWGMESVNRSAKKIVRAAAAARDGLEQKGAS